MPAAPVPAPTADLTAAYPELAKLRSALRTKDWPLVRTIFTDQEPAARSALIRLGMDGFRDRELLQAQVDADPADPLATAMLASHLIWAAWEVRTSYRAEHVTRRQFARFHEILREAEQLLIDATARTPDDPALWTLRLITARGLELGQSEARRRYDRLAAHDPHHLPAQTQLLQQICPKWGGSFEAVHEFARTAMLAAPEGAPNAMLVVDAHLEELVERDTDKWKRYLADPRVREQVRAAAERSVLHPAFRRTIGWVRVQNGFALMLTLIEDYPAAASVFTSLGHLVDEDAWRYLGDPVAKFTEFRQRAYQKAGVR